MKTKKIKLWHATAYDNLGSIIARGLQTGCDHVVYACENATDAAKFVAIRGVKDILLIQFEVNEQDVDESFDHSQAFFKCRAFSVSHNIEPESLVSFRRLTCD